MDVYRSNRIALVFVQTMATTQVVCTPYDSKRSCDQNLLPEMIGVEKVS